MMPSSMSVRQTATVAIALVLHSIVGIAPPLLSVTDGVATPAAKAPLLTTEPEERVAEVALDAIHRVFERLCRSAGLITPEVH